MWTRLNCHIKKQRHIYVYVSKKSLFTLGSNINDSALFDLQHVKRLHRCFCNASHYNLQKSQCIETLVEAFFLSPTVLEMEAC